MPIGVPFRDSGGFRGSRFAEETSKTIAKRRGKNIRFSLAGNKLLNLEIPDWHHKPVTITYDNAIRLAYWLLDKCSRPGG